MQEQKILAEGRFRTTRRDLVLLFFGAAIVWPCAEAHGQQKRPLIGVLALNVSAADYDLIGAFVESLSKLGYIDGKTATIAVRHADGDPQALPGLAADLARLNPDVIMADVASAIRAAKKAAPSVPIVGASMGSPVVQGLVTNFAHPGGNLTGIAAQVEDINAKLLDIALEIIPTAKSFGVLLNPQGDVAPIFRSELQAAADKRNIAFHAAEARVPGDIESALSSLAAASAAFVVVQPNAMLNPERRRVAEMAIRALLPVVSGTSGNAEAGYLLTYGIDSDENYRRAAFFVDKILKGAKAGDLPIEFPTKVEMIVNLKTAKTLGINVPQSLLLRADRVIE